MTFQPILHWATVLETQVVQWNLPLPNEKNSFCIDHNSDQERSQTWVAHLCILLERDPPFSALWSLSALHLK